MKLKRLMRGEDNAVVEAGSRSEADLKAIGFAEKGKAKPVAKKRAAAKKKAPAKNSAAKGK